MVWAYFFCIVPVADGLLQRGSDQTDGRGIQLRLTSQGKALYRRVFPRAVKRNEELLSVLNDAERAVLDRALDLLTEHAQTTLAQARNAYDDGLVRYRVALVLLQTLTGSL